MAEIVGMIHAVSGQIPVVLAFEELGPDACHVGQGDPLFAEAGERVAIVGLGGTGSYVLDFVAKTPVQEIHLFDGDEFLTHNAFRAPGAASLEALRRKPKKVDYLAAIYSNMH